MNNKASKQATIELIHSAIAAGWKRSVIKSQVGTRLLFVEVNLDFPSLKSWEPSRTIQIFFSRPVSKRGRQSVSVRSWANYGSGKLVTKNGLWDAQFQVKATKE